ncbi:MAG: hypothetical protein C5B49_04025 [Bdellovibrio sp.]|nr:MAG: hypothetical protein C5B49_04025 [Bdellovibrio sp.]
MTVFFGILNSWLPFWIVVLISVARPAMAQDLQCKTLAATESVLAMSINDQTIVLVSWDHPTKPSTTVKPAFDKAVRMARAGNCKQAETQLRAYVKSEAKRFATFQRAKSELIKNIGRFEAKVIGDEHTATDKMSDDQQISAQNVDELIESCESSASFGQAASDFFLVARGPQEAAAHELKKRKLEIEIVAVGDAVLKAKIDSVTTPEVRDFEYTELSSKAREAYGRFCFEHVYHPGSSDPAANRNRVIEAETKPAEKQKLKRILPSLEVIAEVHMARNKAMVENSLATNANTAILIGKDHLRTMQDLCKNDFDLPAWDAE